MIAVRGVNRSDRHGLRPHLPRICQRPIRPREFRAGTFPIDLPRWQGDPGSAGSDRAGVPRSISHRHSPRAVLDYGRFPLGPDSFSACFAHPEARSVSGTANHINVVISSNNSPAAATIRRVCFWGYRYQTEIRNRCLHCASSSRSTLTNLAFDAFGSFAIQATQHRLVGSYFFCHSILQCDNLLPRIMNAATHHACNLA
jgi:hypothetical protein